jgi:hypothetical protein
VGGLAGLGHPSVIAVTVDICDSKVALGRSAEVLVELELELERALASLSAGEGDPLMLASVRFVLARALWDAPAGQGRDRARARELVGLARRGHTPTGENVRV